MQRLILIDGNAILHRGFHALPPLTSTDGQLVNAVYGFFSMFLRIIEDFKPDSIIVCFDRPKPTFRKQLYVGYQAKRPKMADELVPQIQLVHEILEKAKVCVFEIDGYEADDLIGTIAKQAVNDIEVGASNLLASELAASNADSNIHSSRKSKSPPFNSSSLLRNLEVIIVSGDRDMLQLINSHVKVAMPIVGITNMTVFDESAVEEKYGIKPLQIVDYKALAGDSSDNYSGVPGIGPKTASLLLKKYVDIEEIYKDLDFLKKENPNLALKLAQGAESAALAKKLAAIVTDAPIAPDFNQCAVGNLGKEGMRQEFERLGFKSLVKRINFGLSKTEQKIQAKNKQLGLL
ncbi:hypothetical protein M1615_00020 [Patescibacteria group bacterium]|nr:hypothetical protein [Patescibacteria group bacterium]